MNLRLEQEELKARQENTSSSCLLSRQRNTEGCRRRYRNRVMSIPLPVSPPHVLEYLRWTWIARNGGPDARQLGSSLSSPFLLQIDGKQRNFDQRLEDWETTYVPAGGPMPFGSFSRRKGTS